MQYVFLPAGRGAGVSPHSRLSVAGLEKSLLKKKP